MDRVDNQASILYDRDNITMYAQYGSLPNNYQYHTPVRKKYNNR
jgi:hypothetical protein